MPFRPEHSLVSLEIPNLRQIDTRSVENLMGMWSLFSKTSHAMEHGKRLENLSWRLWTRETFCCAPERQASSPTTTTSVPTPRPYRTLSPSNAKSKAATTARDMAVPPLSTSLDSVSSGDAEFHRTSHIPQARPELRRNESTASSQSRGNAKHITPIDLQKMVISIKETNLEPIELPMPTPSPRADDPPSTSTQNLSTLHLSPPSPPSHDRTSHSTDSQATLLISSASTVHTNGSERSNTSPPVGSQCSEDSSATEMSSHSIIRGFVPGGAPSSYRSQTNLASQPTPILKTSPQYRPAPPKKKGAMFTIGTSSGEDESSLDSHMHRSVLSDSLRNKSSLRSDCSKKQTSFKDEVAVSKAAAAAVRNSPVFETDDEDEDVSESAIEDDDDSSDWEDSDDASGPSSVNEKDLFQRVDSRPNLTSRRSLLTTLMHEPDRAKALSNAASRSTPAIRRSRTTTPNGPSVATSPETGSLAPPVQLEIPRSKPIIMTTSNTHQNLAMSPRTTRRNMLSSELTESLRKNLLWERQHRSSGNLTTLKRRHTSTDVKTLKQHPEPGPILSHKDGKKKFNNDYFHQGLGEYHAKGW
ncbi:uncharacterized protein MYCFIDRAFT_86181 [Pseudocercospora fijiensis CIRAD86]|uniref:Uncharacterized protein n=1 Tax=Pseudocercospora fijiensis (strain CIRAD86) TaxID=383855 RepID=N1QCA9_PSEFD|nr:uncharacterized protein MYCFIDRAFT_86181 [Pseudocercospora fijiensis CIRAD86]EME89018.1 hypothetical protein MYCFIDRAFT_86181 [Pseudocercospora fijiensis CIRAD86]